jgi:uncharacterized protein YjbI with pentapeptide repeats
VDQQQQDGQQQQSSGGLWAAGIFLVALVFLFIVVGGYVQEWEWTGLTTPRHRKFWDWLDLLIVPAVLGVGAYLLTERQRTLDRELATQQAETDRELADERRQDDTLQAYLDGMSQLLTDKEMPLHRAQPGDSLSTVARARTRTVLGRLDSARKRNVLQFLFESGLIFERRHNIVSLQQADLSRADLIGADLSRANLIKADLSGASLGGANLIRADLGNAYLSSADLIGANLIGANLGGAYLIGANLSGASLGVADLSGARLSRANLREADLGGANLSRADLSRADLSRADLGGAEGVTNEQLSAARSLEGATMPNGQKYEDWLKDKERGKDGENKRPS